MALKESYTYHMSGYIPGLLRIVKNTRDEDYEPWFAGSTGKAMDITILEEHLAEGHTHIPFADCEGFDYTAGCPGHRRLGEDARTDPALMSTGELEREIDAFAELGADVAEGYVIPDADMERNRLITAEFNHRRSER